MNGYQVILQPDGKFAVYSEWAAVLIYRNLTLFEAVQALALRAEVSEKRASNEVAKVVKGVLVYGDDQLSYKAAEDLTKQRHK